MRSASSSRTGRASRVVYLDHNGLVQAVYGKVIVLACSTVDTPRLVQLSRLPGDLVNNDLVGRHLMVHHFPGAIGLFEQRIDYYRGFWSMRCLDDFYMGDFATGAPTFGFGNLQTVGPSSGYPPDGRRHHLDREDRSAGAAATRS